MKKTMACEKIFANDVTGVNIKYILTAYTTQRANKPSLVFAWANISHVPFLLNFWRFGMLPGLRF